MLFISSRLHGIFDYLLALGLVVSPWFLDMSDMLAPAITAISVGMMVLISAIMTDYELSAVRLIPLSLHLAIDVVLGLFLVMSPWLIGFENAPHNVHMLTGLALLVLSAFTVRLPKNTRPVTQYVQWV